ncbi:MAG: hypothetical protein GF329_07730 [Candidatus Lokiarchaeota archaeon]|nr:hypothetical protein [Candidatus Lokiarchaeota archaeon]
MSGKLEDAENNRLILNGEVPFHFFVVSEDPYAEWHYSDKNNVLLSMDSVGNEIPFLTHIFGIVEFIGYLRLVDTNYDIGLIESQKQGFLPSPIFWYTVMISSLLGLITTILLLNRFKKKYKP